MNYFRAQLATSNYVNLVRTEADAAIKMAASAQARMEESKQKLLALQARLDAITTKR